jgi:hypothetical protein
VLLMRNAAGGIVWPGRVRREFTEGALPGQTAPAATWLSVAAGTMTTPSNLSGAALPLATVASAGTSGAAAAVKGAAPLNLLNPALFSALILTLEGFKASADSGLDIEFGFQGVSGGGASFLHLAGAAAGIIRTKNASNVATDNAVNFPFFQPSGGGSQRRNLTFALLPNGYPGDPRVSAHLLMDDEAMVSVDVTSQFDFTHSVVPIFQVVARTAAAYSFSYSQVKIALIHN